LHCAVCKHAHRSPYGQKLAKRKDGTDLNSTIGARNQQAQAQSQHSSSSLHFQQQ
jgi:hypothetical protein